MLNSINLFILALIPQFLLQPGLFGPTEIETSSRCLEIFSQKPLISFALVYLIAQNHWYPPQIFLMEVSMGEWLFLFYS